MRDFLKSEFLKEVKVLDADQAYLAASSFNLRMKPTILKAAASVIADDFKDEQVNVVHGIPHSGNFLATAVALALAEYNPEVRLHSSRKDQLIPTSWKDVYRKEVRSFTTSSGGADVFSGINLSFVKKGDRVLIVDDICATGETAFRLLQGLIEKGVTVVGFAVLFDKVFQGGLERVQSLGVKTCSCVRVAKIGKNDQVTLQ